MRTIDIEAALPASREYLNARRQEATDAAVEETRAVLAGEFHGPRGGHYRGMPETFRFHGWFDDRDRPEVMNYRATGKAKYVRPKR